MNEISQTEADEHLARAVRLFEFLARVQQVKSPSPRTVDAYQDVIWFHRLPAHPALVSAHTTTGLDSENATLVVDRVQRLAPPAAPNSVGPWLDGQLDDPTNEPSLRVTRVVQIPATSSQVDDDDLYSEPVAATVIESLDDFPEVTREFDQWLSAWRGWANDELAARPVRDLYSRLFSVHGAVDTNPEEVELVLGTACLSWHPDGHPAVQRHLLTSPAVVDFDDTSGRLTVRTTLGPEPLTVELDMLDPGIVHDVRRIQDIRTNAQGFEAHPIDRDEAAVFGQRLVHCLDPEGAYLDRDEPTTPHPDAVVSYAPALILRKRSQQGLIQIFQAIAGQLRETGEVPEGIMPLVDPNHVPDPGLSSDGQDGGIVEVDDEVFLPLPVNATQLKIVRSVDRQAQTLVQGPPGTGKTHTAAALISHLVAQGKRVLVTAQTDRALKEVRDKLPESIRPLSVAVVGAAREDMSQLKIAVERIATAAVEFDGEWAERNITAHLSAIDELRRRRAGLYHNLVEAREADVRHYEVHGYSGTIAAIARAHQADEPQCGWLGELVNPGPDALCPLDDAEIAEWRSLLLDDHVQANESDAGQDLLDPFFLPDPKVFADTVAAEQMARDADAAFLEYAKHKTLDYLAAVDEVDRRRLAARLTTLANQGAFLKSRHETWITPALSDVQRHKASAWRARREQICTLLDTAVPLVAQLGLIVDVRVTLDDFSSLVPLARAVLSHIRAGGKVRTDTAGHPRLGALAPRVLRQASPLFDGVRVEGVPPTTAAHLETFLTWVEATKSIDALDRAWPAGTEIPPEDTLAERLQWHITEREQLERVLNFAAALDEHEQTLITLGLPPGNWTDPDEILVLARVVQAVAARLALKAASEPLNQLEDRCAQASRWADANACIRALYASAHGRDADTYRTAHGRLHELLGVRQSIARRDELGSRLADAAPRLHVALAGSPSEPRWDEELALFAFSWRWAAGRSWIGCREHVDVNSLKAELDLVEKEIRDHVEGLTATRAWTHASSPERINGRARADLQHYAQLVKKLGKGTGKYAPQKRTEIRAAMGQCRSSVPVWILPIYRIAEQLRVTPGMFDVVIVDEASQAGLEATFLQYLAPKIVVIGDDKQVSPSAVGVDQQQLIDLAMQYLHDDPYRASWSDPLRSLFDVAKMRFGGLITLVEHRRCVPEIIGFSNRVAYEPDGIRLIPVRQYGADRLEPVKPVFLADGYTKGTTHKINPVEVEAIVDQVAKCLADPRYDGLTFGIISLLGPAQAKAIEKALLETIPSEEWSARDLRCGDSADFQGSERDVMFLSMVAAPEPGRRLGALTMDMYVQRYNVAASRAKDQMWVFHSVPLTELSNPEDMRFALLDYCYGVANRPSETSSSMSTSVPEDTRVAPFDSLFEQRVFNRLVDRGYSVIPQYEVEGYRIDLGRRTWLQTCGRVRRRRLARPRRIRKGHRPPTRS